MDILNEDLISYILNEDLISFILIENGAYWDEGFLYFVWEKQFEKEIIIHISQSGLWKNQLTSLNRKILFYRLKLR